MMSSLLPVLLGLACTLLGMSARAGEPSKAEPTSLMQTIIRLDSEVFEAFNRCSDPAQLEKHASFFSESVEFYHDNSGVTWNRKDMLANTRKHACGNYTRELIPGSAVVYPIKDFGAIELGSHRFCQVANGKCEGLADFTIVWQQTSEGWKITRVLSYGHRSSVGGP